jgi:hypothetical protein
MLVVNVVVMGRVAWVAMAFHFQGLSKISADFATAMGPRAVAATESLILARYATCAENATAAMRRGISVVCASFRPNSQDCRALAATMAAAQKLTAEKLWMHAAFVEDPTCVNGVMVTRRWSQRAPQMPSSWMFLLLLKISDGGCFSPEI